MRGDFLWKPIILIGLAMLYAGPCRGETPEGAQQFAALSEFRLQNGEIVNDFRVGYRTMGKLNSGKTNAILWPTWLGGRSEDLLAFAGPGKVVDSGKYFVILVDSIGNGITTSPSNSMTQPRMKFPQFTVRDMIEAEYRLVTQVLWIPHLHAVMGLSLGAMQAFEWAAAYPRFMDLTIAMSGSPQSTAADKMLWTTEIEAIELDPAWNDGNPKGPLEKGVALAEEIDALHASSPVYINANTPTADFPAMLAGIKKRAKSEPGAVIDQIRQRQAILALDIPREYGVTMEQAAARVKSRMLVMISPEDHMVNPKPAIQFARAVGAPLIILDSPCGHRSFSCISTGPIIAQFLADPSSIKSQTLRGR